MGYDYQWRNIDDATVQGIELSFMANLMRTLAMGIDLTYNHGEYKNARLDWIGTDYEEDSRSISRFPTTTANLKIEYTPETWSFSVSGNFQGKMYIDYYNSEIDPNLGVQTKIKTTDPFILVNARASKTIKAIKLYAGVNNLLNYLQDERHLDDAAFMYAPVYGTMFYGGLSVDIHH
jgi:outer membrane receptor for ferrienterochelin and colicins